MKKYTGLFILISGLINGLLGAGGGMVTVPALEKTGLKAEKAHATALAIMLPLSALSAAVYIFTGRADVVAALKYMPAGVLGALFGAWLLPRIPERLLKLLFGFFALWAGGRILFK